jgi:hypothetical protein
MEKEQLYSHWLLYSVAPEHFSSLQLNNERGEDMFDWEADNHGISSESLVQIVQNFLGVTATKWGLIHKETK